MAQQSNFGYAAFTRADVTDAARRRPDNDLRAFAAERRLEFVGSQLPSGFSGVFPRWPDYVFNCVRGVWPTGDFGTLAHELYEVGVDSDGLAMNGEFHSVRARSRWTWLGLWERGPMNEPFAANAVWVPATRAAIRLPEAALVDYVAIRRSDRLPPLGSTNLERYGVPGFRASGEPGRVLEAFLEAGGGAVLAGLPYPFVELIIGNGHLALVRNGYARDDRELDRLASEAGRLAAALRSACVALAAPRPFDVALPPPLWADPAWRSPNKLDVFSEPWWDAFRRVGVEQGLALEDPSAFHRAFPHQPVPGRAAGVVRGAIPPVGLVGRLAWFTDGGSAAHAIRGAALFPAAPGASTPPGGFIDPTTELVAEARDGIAACWTRSRAQGSLGSRELMANAAATLRAFRLIETA